MIEVSVIITSYNVAPYIERAVRSALTQEGIKLEVIVVDDCSTDDTWNIISAINDPRLRTRRNHENCGPSISRNEAIAMANGAYIAVLDGDDEFLPGRLARCLVHMPAADIVVDNIEVRRERDSARFPMFPSSHFARNNKLTLAEFVGGNRLLSKSFTLGYLKPVFSTVFLRQHSLAYDPEIRIGEDYLLLAQALALGAACAIEPNIGYAYTARANSISHRLTSADIDRMIKADTAFIDRHILTGKALKAQKKRTKSLRRAYYFTFLVDSIKQRDIIDAGKIVFTCPTALHLLRHPIMSRLERLRRSFFKGTNK